MKWITKIVLVALVIWAFLLANQVILQNQQMFQRHVKESVARLQQPALPNTFDSAPPPAFPWRKFPGATLLSHRSWKMNEIAFLEAEYQVTASPGDLIEY